MALKRSEFEPAYLRLYKSGELARRVDRALSDLADCTLCPRDCHVNRQANEFAVCRTGRYARVSSHFPHQGEEDCLRGWSGSGTIFFSWCNLRCVFCQNYDVSWQGQGGETRPEELAEMMLHLQALGCHNINFVTPEHVVPQILEALPSAIRGGLRLPLVYNTGAYDSLESIELMDGVVDIYMPDFKIWDAEMARRYLKAPNYPDAARRVIKAMHQQVGDLVMDENGLALRGVLLRHLVMPGEIAGTREIMDWVARELGPNTYVNVMQQYRPAGKVSRTEYAEMNRRITGIELKNAIGAAHAAGLHRLDGRFATRV
ncbi:MAG TPA: radical SAM protein [Candidatus Acidoferrales bacterium]|nr:radical SAM protein [Candidatus Acidoferrales bacterium]